MTREEYLDKNYSKIREGFEDQLVEQGYPRRIASESDDGWDEYLEYEKDIFYRLK